MSGGSFNYLCDRDGLELTNRTHELQDMTKKLRDLGYEPEAWETETIIEQVNLFQQTIEARAKDLRSVWKSVEWFVSNDWDRAAITGAVQDHRANHPEATLVPGLPLRDWETGAVSPKLSRPPRVVDPETLEPLPKPDSLDDDDYRWAEDQDRWATEFREWIVSVATDAIRAQDEQAEERKAKAAEEARWDARRAELIEQFNGGPLQVTNGQPIPTMALKAVEYIIETERKKDQGYRNG